MHLNFSGFTRQQRKLLRHAVPHFMGNLVHRNLLPHLSINLIRTKKKRNYLGECLAGENKRDFDIAIYGKPKERDLLFVVAHECAHIKQWATGERIDLKRYANRVKFHGKTYDLNSIPYDEHPWEVDAYAKEEGLVIRFLADYPEYWT